MVIEWSKLLLRGRIRPFLRWSGVLWPRLTPPHPSVDIAAHLLRCRRSEEVSQGKTVFLPSSAAGFTVLVSDWPSGVPFRCRVTHHGGLISGSCSSAPSFAAGFLPTPPRDDAVALG